ncbi:flagellar type III secretion system pore protein FliP [Buchnera aphidicola (Takecallis taiwana)]|uniref:flagellar type III secretion system pore protein FliP n=1 Tax=Buchnera aphidicola TaxID=9 RepID=UPI0031B73623
MKDIFGLFNQKIFYNNNFFFKTIIVLFLILWIIKIISFVAVKNNHTLIQVITQKKIDSNNKIFILDISGVRLILGSTLYNIRTLYTLPISDDNKKNIVQNYIENSKLSLCKNIIYKLFFFLILCCYSSNAYAAEFSELTKHIFFNNISHWSCSSQIVLLTCIVTLVSALIIMTTSFTRIIIVLSLLRNALGIPTLPPNQLLMGISFCLTCYVMYPTYHRIYQEAYIPFYTHHIQIDDIFIKLLQPIYDFMLHQTRRSDLLVFSQLSHLPLPDNDHTIPIQILLPSFITSELKTAFQIGFTIFIPFLMIDLFITTILMSLGMTMISPNTISLPVKLILFVLVDGWQLIFSSLINSFY